MKKNVVKTVSEREIKKYLNCVSLKERINKLLIDSIVCKFDSYKEQFRCV